MSCGTQHTHNFYTWL